MSFNRKEARNRRHLRIRQRIKGTAARPRMAIYVSNKHMYVQFIDDVAMSTLAATSSLKEGQACNLATARLIGKRAAGLALEKGLSTVVVDRGGFKYHGRVREIVEAAVAAGLKISERAAEAKEAK